jgi:hypothetical protein
MKTMKAKDHMNDPHRPRILSTAFEQELLSGKLSPLLTLIQRDRDLIAEIRDERLDVYCKGNCLINIQPKEGGQFRIQSHAKFWTQKVVDVRDRVDVGNFCKAEIPFIKQRIAEHSPKGKEVEFEQMLIRSCNLEALNADYIAVDRQGLAEDGAGRTDVIGVFWPGDRRGYDNVLSPALIEVKYGLAGGVEGLADQIRRYYNDLKPKITDFAAGLQGQLRQKARLGLLSGLSAGAQSKIQGLHVSPRIDDLRVVIALVDYNPRATRLDEESLRMLDFASQIDLFYLGFGMWKKNAVRLTNG